MIKQIDHLFEHLIGTLSSRSHKNVIWNLVGGVFGGGLIVLVSPVYVSKLGLEGYGILGLWLMLQVMSGLLDVGMGASLMRSFADSRSDCDGLLLKRDLLRTMEILYWFIAVMFAVVIIIMSPWIGGYWLQTSTISNSTVVSAFRLMAVALGLQFPYTLYSSGLVGLQAQGKMNALQIMGNTLRYGCGVAVLFWRADIVCFFLVQTMVAAIQTFATRKAVWGMISGEAGRQPVFRIAILQQMWRFSTGMALTAVAAVFMANADRLVLSKLATASELGKYSVAFTATGLLQLGIQPFYRAYFPRYSELFSAGETNLLRDEYLRSCRLLAAVIIPIGILGVVFAPELFNVWLGKHDETIIAVFRWLLVGMTCAGLMWLPAAFQQAHGWANLHAAMIAGALVFGAPVMVWAIKAYGPVGATAVWVVHGFSDITLGLWLMHRRLLVGELLGWYRAVLVPPMLVCLPLGSLSWWLLPQGQNKWFSLCWIAITASIVMGTALFLEVGRARTNRQLSL